MSAARAQGVGSASSRSVDGSEAAGGSPTSAFRLLLDFDGTLVTPNVAILLVGRFCPDGERLAREVDRALHEGRMTLREAWARQVALLPADRYEEMVDFVRAEVPLRPGARRLTDLARASGIPTTIVSGGLDFFIRPVLEREGLELPILSDSVITTDEGGWAAAHPYGHSSCRLCGICKAKLVAPPELRSPTVFVGDGSTDRFAAEVASVVFARARLRSYCERFAIPHYPFEDLDTVADQIHRWVSHAEPFPEGRPVGRTESECPISSAIARGQPYRA